jgi:hypothetical protein
VVRGLSMRDIEGALRETLGDTATVSKQRCLIHRARNTLSKIALGGGL